MHITYEKHKDLSLIYVYLRNSDDAIVSTMPYVYTSLLLDKNDNWIGFEIFNYGLDESEIELPNLNSPYIPQKNEIVEMSKERILVLFDSTSIIDKEIGTECNIDYNENGLQGFEFILSDFAGKYEIASKFTQ